MLLQMLRYGWFGKREVLVEKNSFKKKKSVPLASALLGLEAERSPSLLLYVTEPCCSPMKQSLPGP